MTTREEMQRWLLPTPMEPWQRDVFNHINTLRSQPKSDILDELVKNLPAPQLSGLYERGRFCVIYDEGVGDFIELNMWKEETE